MFPAHIYAVSSVIVVGIQTGSKTSASEELIELYNTSSQNQDITGWKLEYLSSAPKDFSIPSRTIILSGSITPQSTYMLTSTNFMIEKADVHFAPTLAASGGHLRLRSNDMKTTYDLVGWGTATHASGNPALAPAPGEILRRQKTNNGDYSTTGDNAADFSTPSSADATMQNAVDQSTIITISELLPNPGSPLTDSKDEFIELHNGSSDSVQLKGYSIWAGTNLSYSYKIPDMTLQPDEYKALFARDTRIALSNSGGQVVLKNPGGTTVSETSPYDTALENKTWAWDGSTWAWSDTATPGAVNIVKASTAQSASIPLAAPPKPIKVPKVASRKTTTKAIKSKTTDKKKVTDKPKKSKNEEPTPTLHPGILAGVGGSAVLYGAYEYRRDAATFIQKLREHRSNRRKNR
ncbi:MAG: lamin tail domain-containing protein [Candidatus Saccharibacteria bacterium]|nr:lamin tail domain-containing protein [Candidatus Saccharibacteria bacterium]